MPHKILSLPVLLAATGLCLSGCSHVAPGGVKESATSFGIPGVFKVTNETKNVSVTEKNIRVGDTSSEVQILLFELKQSAKGVRLTNPEDKP